LSYLALQNARMKTLIKALIDRKSTRIIATFGRACLVSLPDGSVELRGGAPGDQTAAKEWISLFMHEVVPRFGP
jgi:hypothetical protein